MFILKKTARTYGRHRNRRISAASKESQNDSLTEPEVLRRESTKSSVAEESFLTSLIPPSDDNFFKWSHSGKRRNESLLIINENSSSSSPKLHLPPDSKSLLFNSLKRSSVEEIDVSLFPKMQTQKNEVKRKVRRKVKRRNFSRKTRENENIVLSSGIKNKVPLIDWDEIERYSLTIEKDIPKVFEKNNVSPSSSNIAHKKLDSLFYCSPLRDVPVNSLSPFPQVASADPSPIRNTDPEENCVSALCSAGESPDLSSRRCSVVQDENHIKTSTPLISSVLCPRQCVTEKVSTSLEKNSLQPRRLNNKLIESLTASKECLDRILSSRHNAVGDQTNFPILTSNENSPVKGGAFQSSESRHTFASDYNFLCHSQMLHSSKIRTTVKESSVVSDFTMDHHSCEKSREASVPVCDKTNRIIPPPKNNKGGSFKARKSSGLILTNELYSCHNVQMHCSVVTHEAPEDYVVTPNCTINLSSSREKAHETSSSISEISFLPGGVNLKDVSPVAVEKSCSFTMNRKNFQDKHQLAFQPHSRENSFKTGEIDNRSLIANLRKNVSRMNQSLKKTSEPSTPVRLVEKSMLTKAYSTADWPGHVRPCQISVTPLNLPHEVEDNDNIELTEEDHVLDLCSQDKPIPFLKAFDNGVLKTCKKIGEGVYGEVFRLKHKDGCKTALKLIPIEGNFKVNGETQKTFSEILPEIVITKKLSNLSEAFYNSTPNFIKVKKMLCLKGRYPSTLLEEWDKYNLAKESLNDRPDMYQNSQLFIGLECADGGTDLESIQLKNASEAVSIFTQVACTLAIAEQSVQFEHRDLHWGNILVSKCKEPEIEYTLNGQDFSVDTNGVHVSIIDFTLSRLGKDGCTVFTDLSQDPTLFTGEGDYQFDIYRLMKEHNKNDWESFTPYSNVLWLHYLLDKLCSEKNYKNKLSKKHKSAKQQLLQWKDTLLPYQSATDFVYSFGAMSVNEHSESNLKVSGKSTRSPETEQRKPLQQRKASTTSVLSNDDKIKKSVSSSAAKLKKSSRLIASKKTIPGSRIVRGSVRKVRHPQITKEMTLKSFNVRI